MVITTNKQITHNNAIVRNFGYTCPNMLRFLSKYLGVISGAGYGLLFRMIMDERRPYSFGVSNLFSITFVWVIPVLIGITPMLFASNDQLRSRTYRCFTPFFAVLLFFIVCLITRIEDLVCIIIIAIPFLAGSVVSGLLFGWLILKLKNRNGTLYSVLLIPFIAGPVEDQFKMPSGLYEVKNVVIINSGADKIWSNIIRVKNIGDDEFSKGFFNYAGIPRPLYAELDRDTTGATRIGHFEGGLLFKETVKEWDPSKKIAFDIHVINSTVRQTVFDKHVLLGDHFKFEGAAYQLIPVSSNQTKLVLSSTYRLDTRINYYACFWGDALLSDFQQRLLDVIKTRCEK